MCKCEVVGCETHADTDTPADLCTPHWDMWFNGDIEDEAECLEEVLAGRTVEPLMTEPKE